MRVQFKEWDCKVVFTKYRNNNRNAIELIDDKPPYFECVTVASVNIPEIEIADDEIAIKDYAENEGVLNCLIQSGIISKPLRYAKNDFVRVPICKLLIKE